MAAIYETIAEQYGQTLTPSDVADILKCHPSHVRAMCSSGDLPAVRISKRWYIPTAAFVEKLNPQEYRNE